MNINSMQRLEFEIVKEQLKGYTVSYLGVAQTEQLTPIMNVRVIRQKLAETEEALGLIRYGASVPLPSLTGMENIMNLLGTGYLFTEHDFMNLLQFLRSCHQLKKYMNSKKDTAPNVASYADSMYTLDPLREEIERCIYLGRITDQASKELAKTRKQVAIAEERMKKKLDALLSKHRSILQDQLVTKRGERYCLPVQKEFRKLLKGNVVDESASGQTVFIEPADISMLQMELNMHKAQEQREESKILSELTVLAESSIYELKINTDTVGLYDFLFAKARYALSMQARSVEMTSDGIIDLHEARHPLVGNMVPLDFHIGDAYRSLIITGPNTGGKTLCLKTIGLLTLMAQSGLLVPVGEGSKLSIFEQITVDIGDGQSIEHALSTFSAHIKNMIEILNTANASTLVLIDEMASGTDPGEGTGLSIALLEELHKRKAVVVATTHFTEIKNFAGSTPGFENARMEFDTDSLKPLYRLTIGQAGQSYAFAIALKLGIPPHIIERSKEIAAKPVATSFPPSMESAVTKPEKVQEEPSSTLLNRCEEKEPHILEPKPKLSSEVVNTGEHKDKDQIKQRIQIGDRVYIPFMKESGIIAEEEDARGQCTVIVKGKRIQIASKRVKLHISAEELYPEDYDFDIVFESKDARKKRKLMSRKHVPGLIIEKKPEDL
ncbi:DNA mismatch repair protein MutS [Paenibacillus sp. Marseille-Q4541]|uniref:endonuclease MutS2 n=1 Tax=Paenibacillus sp. Marseille-Q4541 TaxID=2831522 RepID=UPI001BA8C32A|nr:DNA mismatch repair protein MutS [Paenibacillus sp. Marseille-Q4541]